MKSLLAVFFLYILTGTAFAETNPLVGRFTHDFTSPKNQSVWTVKRTGNAWQVLVHGSHQTVRARQIGDAERAEFWDQMWWPADKSKDAQCLLVEAKLQGMICYVQRSTRSGISDLSSRKSDYFYFDSMGGLMEIRRKDT